NFVAIRIDRTGKSHSALLGWYAGRTAGQAFERMAARIGDAATGAKTPDRVVLEDARRSAAHWFFMIVARVHLVNSATAVPRQARLAVRSLGRYISPDPRHD